MAADRERIISLLKDTSLFGKLAPEQIARVADQFQSQTYTAEEVIFHQGDRAESFYLVLEGKVEVLREADRRKIRLAVFVPGDYFGEEALLYRQRRTASVKVLTPATLIYLTRTRFELLLKTIPTLKPTLSVAVSSRRLARKLHFPWLAPDEVIYVMARRHPIFLLRAALFPSLGLIASLALSLALYTSQSAFPSLVYVGLALSGLMLAWLAWNLVDFTNDYYIVTSQRVVELEKVVLLYDSRDEAPLSSILSVGIETSFWGRRLGYGSVVVRTFTRQVTLEAVSYPKQVAAMVEEYWSRVKRSSRKEEKDAMENAIRKKLGLGPKQDPYALPPKPDASAKTPGTAGRTVKPGVLQNFLSTLFMLRFQSGPVVTYRKHWFVLLQQTWMPLVLFLLGWVGLALLIIYPIAFLSAGAIAGLLFFYQTGLFLWWLYEYIDWRNDIYQITQDQVIDIEKRPLASEVKKVAPLESILSIEYSRIGLIGMLLNYGTVNITVGGTKFAFNAVFNPSEVQQDIARRREELLVRKRRGEQDAERERVSDWIATYHRNASELRQEVEEKPEEDAFSE
jgi:uncharacterized membrane protein YdbT with pleckstrin-like domain